MSKPSYLETKAGHEIAYHHSPGVKPTLVFLGGFRSDMEGTKALHLERWARGKGRAFLRMDYSGHGESGGDFLQGYVGAWAEDAHQVITQVCDGPVVLVGSSMGGWIALLLARKLKERVKGLVGIASAPDFTEDSMWEGLDESQRKQLQQTGQVSLPSLYADEPYVITRRLIEEGRKTLVLRDPLVLPFPVRFLQGTADEDVDVRVALRLLDHAVGDDIRLTLVKGADHRFSTEDCLALIERSVTEVLERAARA